MRKVFNYIGLWPEKTPDQNPFLELEIDLKHDAKAWELFQYFRDEIKHEHALLAGRVTWFITCQSLLLTVYAISYSNCRGHNWFSNIFVPIFSIAVTVLALNMIQGATLSINMWSDMRMHLIRANPSLNSVVITRWRYPAIHNDAIHAKSLWFPKFIPMLFYGRLDSNCRTLLELSLAGATSQNDTGKDT
jgi:hypothetical protein